MKKKFTSIALALVILGSSATAVFAESAGGGDWEHSITLYQVTSNYLHNSKVHGSTAENNVSQVFSGWANAGVWSRITINASLFGNAVYYKTK